MRTWLMAAAASSTDGDSDSEWGQTMVADRRDIASGDVSPDTLFNTLGAAHCWEVLECLLRHSCTVSGIADVLHLDISEISRSLQRLHDLGLVQWHQFRKYRMYAVAPCVQCAQNDHVVHLTIKPAGYTQLSIALAIEQQSQHSTLDVPS